MRRDKFVFLLSSAPLVVGFTPIIASNVRRSVSSTTGSSNNNNDTPSTSKLSMFSNPLDMMSSMFQSPTVTAPNTQVEAALKSSELPGWTNLRETLESKMVTKDEQDFRANLSKGYGVGSPLHKVRLFDPSNKEEDIRVTFYRDSASWCPYCQKVWLTLEEKKIPYRVEKINMRCYGEKPDSFRRMQPSGAIPVATIDGTTLRQSNDILFALEDLFPKHKSLSPPSSVSSKAQDYLRLERQIFSAWMYWLTGGGAQAKQNFLDTLEVVERSLGEVSGGPFLLGKDISIVDVQFAPFLERMAASLLYYKGFQMRVSPGVDTAYPNLNAWFDAMETLPSYQLTKSDYYTHCWDLPPQLGGCVPEKGGEAYEAAINGLRRLDGSMGSWELPLQPHNGGVEPDWTWAGDEAAAKREAVERLSANADAIVRFASRGAGKKGVPAYGASLSDPNAMSNEAIQPAVDHMFRLVCLGLLEGTEAHEASLQAASKVLVEKGGDDYAAAVLDSLVYLRDRVGVPRDMKLPAAQQLRAHLNWAIGKILSELES